MSRRNGYPRKTVAAFLAYAARRPDAVVPDLWKAQHEDRHETPARTTRTAGGRRPGPELTAADGTAEAPLPAGDPDDR